MFRVVFFGAMVSMTSCDPVYTVTIKNSTADTIQLKAITSSTFYDFQVMDSTWQETGRSGFWVEKTMAPNEALEFGSVIGEIDDEVPFDELVIYLANDSIIARNQSEVLELMERNIWGAIKAPYQLIIRN